MDFNAESRVNIEGVDYKFGDLSANVQAGVLRAAYWAEKHALAQTEAKEAQALHQLHSNGLIEMQQAEIKSAEAAAAPEAKADDVADAEFTEPQGE